MRPWRARLALRRSRVQWALLWVVILVAGLSATALSSLFLLSTATETFAARQALENAPATSVRISDVITPRGETEDVIARSTETATEFFGDIPVTTSVHIQSEILAIPRTDKRVALGYFGYFDGISEAVVLDEGRLPENVAGDEIEVAVPTALLAELDVEVGDEFEVFAYGSRKDSANLTIVGSYTVRDPEGDFWRDDGYSGQGYTSTASVPFSGGRLTTDGYGPLLVAREEIGRYDAAFVTTDHVPDFSNATLAQVAASVDATDDLDYATTVGLGDTASHVIVRSQVRATLGRILGSLAVTRSSVLVTGLLVLVLAIAALAQTSRLMSERRHSEQMLMRARGSSGRQLLYLGVLEALFLGIATAVAGPPLARLAYRGIASVGPMKQAGMNVDPGLPALVWVVSGIIGLALVLVVSFPLLRRGGTFVEGEQSRSRPGRATALQRSGLDAALVALAVLAYLQLRGYQSPVLTSDGVARVDPLLAAGPALALLAGALLCVRLIPAASRFLEGVASRGRRAVTPLAAWEVGRRSARAVSAILLLTLAVAVGSFTTAFLSTWHASQRDQASFSHPADVEVAGVDGDPLAQRAAVSADSLDAVVAPVLDVDGEITTSLREGRSGSSLSGRPFHLRATTDDGLRAFTLDRVGTEGGLDIARALTINASGDDIAGIALPGDASGVQFDLTLDSSETTIEGLSCTIRVIILDAEGAFVSLDAGTFPIDGETRTVRAIVPRAGDASGIASPAQIIGLQTLWFVPFGANDGLVLGGQSDLSLSLSIDGISTLVKRADVPVVQVSTLYDVEPTEALNDIQWYGRAEGVVGPNLTPVDDQVHIAMTIPPSTILSRTISISQGVFAFSGELPVVANESLLDQLGIGVGDRARIAVDDAVVTVHVVGSVPLMPGGSPRSPALVANYDDLQVLLMQSGATSTEPTSWWVDVPADNLDRYLDTLPEEATVTTRVEVVHSLTDDPLRVAIQAALWLVAGAAVVLAAVGFAVHAVVTVRARQIEFAQLRAVGLSRGSLTRLIAAESTLLGILGTIFGLVVGIALSYLVAPLVSVGPDGRPPVPSVIVDIPWAAIGLLAAEVAAVLVFVVVVVSLIVRRIDPAALLRVEA